MAQGSIRTRCKVCRKSGLDESKCQSHKEIVYEGRVWANGKQVSITRKTKGAVQSELRDILGKVEKGIYKKVEPATFKQCADLHLSECSHVRVSTYSEYNDTIKNHLRPILDDCKMASIGWDLIDKVMKLAETKGATTARKVKNQLKSIFKLAVMRGFITSDITASMRRTKQMKKKRTYYVLNPSQIDTLLNLPFLKPWFRLYLKMAIYTGMRPSELLAISLDAIDLNKGQIKIERKLTWLKRKQEKIGRPDPWIFEPCKTGAAYRTLPLSKDLIKDIEIYLLTDHKENKYNLLFTSKKGKPVCLTVMRLVWWPPARKAASLPDNFRMYDLRHTYCSIVGKIIGLNKRLQYLMGHDDFNTTANTYSHIFPEDNTDIMTAFDSLMLTKNSHNGQKQAEIV